MIRSDYGIWLILTDIVGAGVLAGCVVMSVWLVFVRSNQASSEIIELRNHVGAVRQSLVSVQSFSEEQNADLLKARVELDAIGQLPLDAPVEKYAQIVLDLAARHRLRVIRQNPTASRTYPGLLEQRYAYEMSGATRDLIGFLAAIERTDFWADISYLRFDGGRMLGPQSSLVRSGRTAGPDRLAGERSASFTVSMFSALPTGTEKGLAGQLAGGKG